MDIPIYVYKYLLGLAVILVLIFSFTQYFKSDSSRLFKISLGWFTVLMVANLVNMIVTLNHYENNSNKVGLKGPLGQTGPRGFKGKGDNCGSICGTQGLESCAENEKDENGKCQIRGNEINDEGIPNFSDIVKPGKCIFPFVHNYQNRYYGDGCIKEDGSAPAELTNYSENGWCATELNSDKTPRKYAYCGESSKEIAMARATDEQSENEREMTKDNVGILDIKLISGNRSTIECPTGYTKINKDLNEGSGGAYVYMCKKTGYGSKGVKSIRIAENNQQCSDLFPQNSDLQLKRLTTDLNKDADVSGIEPERLYMCLGYDNTKFLTDIKVTDSTDSPGEEYDLINVNLNKDTDGPDLYLHTSDKREEINPLSSAFYYPKDKKLYFIGGAEGKYFYYYDEVKKQVSSPDLVKNKFGKIPDNINAVFTWNYDEKTYFFKGRFIYKINDKKMTIADGYPKSLNYKFKGIPDNIDAVFSWDKDGATYFFKDKFVYKFDNENKRVSPGYPRLIKSRFPGAPNKVDAVYFNRNDGQTYFIRGNQYFILNNNETVGRDYPKNLNDKYPLLGILPKVNKFNTALGLGNKMYFFSNKQYYEYTNKLGEPVNLNSVRSIFKGVPENFDCAMASEHNNENTNILFFKGSQLYEFEKANNKLVAGFPREITDFFSECPDDLDASIFFENEIYLFKNDNVFKYVYTDELVQTDPTSPLRRRVIKLEENFPKKINRVFANMPSNVDAFTNYNGDYYVIKGIQYYIVNNNKTIELKMGVDNDDENKYPQYLDNKFENLNTAVDRRNIIGNND